MNIAIFASSFHPHIGGVEELVRQLALELVRRGHSAIVLTNRWPRKLPRQKSIEGISLYRLPFRAPDAGLKSAVSFRLSRDAIEREVCSILARHSIDVIHVQCVSSNGFYAVRASRRMNLPLVVTLQGELTMDSTGLFERSEFARQTLRECIAGAEIVTACSRNTLEDGERFFGKSLGRVVGVIYNGIDLADSAVEPFKYPRPYILAIGRHVPQKGFDVLLRAMASLVTNQTFDHDLILAGDGTEHQRLRAIATELNLGERVVFTGRVSHAEAMRLFRGCSFFVLPSRHEPFGIVNLEAMACGKAVVATRVGGVPEIVNDEITGLLVEPENVNALVGAITRLVADERLRHRLGEAGRRHAERFGWPQIARQYVTCYEQSIAPRSSAEQLQTASTDVAGVSV